MQQVRDERSLGELFTELSRETSTLVRQEVELARAEMAQKAAAMGRSAGFMVAGGMIAYAGFLAILAAAIIALAALVPWWLSALIVGLVVAGAGLFLVQQGRNGLKQTDLAPEQTIATLKEDARWAREQVR